MPQTASQFSTSPFDQFSADILRDSSMRKSYSATAIKAFIRMMEQWELPVIDRCAILGDVAKQTYYKWARDDVGTLSRDQLERIGITLGIYKALKLLFADEGGRKRWFTSPNHDYAFKGQSPAERMAQGGMTDLYAVRQYVDAMRGGR